MATTASPVKVEEKAPFKPLSTTPRVVEVIPVGEPYTVREVLPLELRLKRQREIIHARRGELKGFLSPRRTRFQPLRSTSRVAGFVRPKVPSAGQEMLALQVRLGRQREIIHTRRGELKRFLSPR